MLKKVLIIANPVAGKALGSEYADLLAETLIEHHDSKAVIKLTQQENDATRWASESASQGFDTVFSLGGDGTVNEVIKGLMAIPADERPYFSFIPMGTVNDLARAIGLPMNPQRVINHLPRVKTTTMDVGKVNDEYFCNVIAVGIIPEEVMRTNSDDKNRYGVFAYIKDGIQAFFSHRGYQIQVTDAEGHSQSIQTNLLMVALTNSVGGLEFMFNQATYNDGLLHFAAISGHHPIATFNAALELSFDNLSDSDLDNIVLMQSTAFKIQSDSDTLISTNMDGDLGPYLPLDIRVIPNALKVILPRL